jgi:hypothetical protein
MPPTNLPAKTLGKHVAQHPHRRVAAGQYGCAHSSTHLPRPRPSVGARASSCLLTTIYILLYGGSAWDAKRRKRRRPPLALRMLRMLRMLRIQLLKITPGVSRSTTPTPRRYAVQEPHAPTHLALVDQPESHLNLRCARLGALWRLPEAVRCLPLALDQVLILAVLLPVCGPPLNLLVACPPRAQGRRWWLPYVLRALGCCGSAPYEQPHRAAAAL